MKAAISCSESLISIICLEKAVSGDVVVIVFLINARGRYYPSIRRTRIIK
jgi:hypothetical protein